MNENIVTDCGNTAENFGNATKSHADFNISDDKILEIVKEVVGRNFNENNLQGGIERLEASTKTLFGYDIAKNLEYIADADTVELLFKYLIALKVPPTEVDIRNDAITLYWCPTGKLPINSNGEYIDLLLQFQEYISSIKLMDLDIDFYGIANPTEEYEDGEILPAMFTEENFSYYHRKEIMFIELFEGGKGQYWLQNDTIERTVGDIE